MICHADLRRPKQCLSALLHPVVMIMQAARSAEPPDMAKEIRKQEAQQDAKRKKQREKEAAAGKGPDAQPGAADQENKSKIKITRYGSGVETLVEEFEAVVEDDEEGILDDIEDDTAVDPMQVTINLHIPIDCALATTRLGSWVDMIES